MLKLIFSVCFVLIIFSCAKITPLDGGDKDTLSPVLIYSNPKNHSINFKEKTFSFEFNEIIDASELSRKLIISPYLNTSPELKFKKNTLLLTFDSSFKENTTYILNFADGVKDITEGNPAKNTKLVFSTGDKIDSSFVSGFVLDPLKNKFVEGALVVLYNKKDSLGLFNKKPLYFSFSNKDGSFLIENIKPGEYKMYSFIDENKKIPKLPPPPLPLPIFKKSENKIIIPNKKIKINKKVDVPSLDVPSLDEIHSALSKLKHIN